jgi:rod shape-determining protein MreB
MLHIGRFGRGKALAMDLGTKNTLIYAHGQGILLNEPSMVTVDKLTGQIVAVGREALTIQNSASTRYETIRPLREGVIANFEMTAVMIREFLKRCLGRWNLLSPTLVIGVPSCITQVESRAVLEAATQSGIRNALLIHESTAAAIGAGLSVSHPGGSMIVDIGGGTSEVSVLSMNGVVSSKSVRVAGDAMDEHIQRYVKRQLHLLISLTEAEKLKLLIGSALPYKEEQFASVTGRDVRTGMPRKKDVGSHAIHKALEQPLKSLSATIWDVLEACGPEIVSDVGHRGVVLAGGGALLKGLDVRIHHETNLPVVRAEDPLSCVVLGVGHVIDNFEEFKELCFT